MRHLRYNIPFRQSLNKSNCRLCKDVGLYRVPISQSDDLRCAVFKIKPQFTPLAVVVDQIFVDSGGDRFALFLELRLPQRNCVWDWPSMLLPRSSEGLVFPGRPSQTARPRISAVSPPVSPARTESPFLQRCWTLSYPNLPV